MKITLIEPYLSEFKRIQAILGEDNVYLVGGFVRDYLLSRSTDDMDFASPLPPKDFFPLFGGANYITKYGTLSFKENNLHITIAAFRKEEGYQDFRHPSTITFISDMKEDSKRRDFTINALYVDKDGNVIDPIGLGLSDLENKVMRVIGDPDKRFQEDPLRILRAYRFAFSLGFTLDKVTKESIQRQKHLIRHLKEQKILEEIHKCPASHREAMKTALEITLEKD
jgi:tRNA nucleotidyltransferase (CCA-adding enzyme)